MDDKFASLSVQLQKLQSQKPQHVFRPWKQTSAAMRPESKHSRCYTTTTLQTPCLKTKIEDLEPDLDAKRSGSSESQKG